MLINKVLNNNVITIINENDEEAVVMGRGIAFQKKKGDEVDKDKIDKIFVLKSKSLNEKLIALVKDIPVENLEIAEEVINYAEEKLGTKLNENIYLTLTDHISFSINRYENNLEMKNVMLWDIKRLHKTEFSIGLKALEIIKNRFGIELPEDEAAAIAMHILNGELSQDMPQIVDIINLINEVLKIVKYHFNIDFDEESLSYYRFVTHLKYFGLRCFNHMKHNQIDSLNNDILEIMKEKYVDAYLCVLEIKKYVKQKYNYILEDEEILFLTIHVAKIILKK